MADSNREGADHSYHGIFRKLRDLNIYENTPTEDLYGPKLADFYNRFVGDFIDDIPLFESLLTGTGTRVLDLACGAGRIGIALARSGTYVDGLELSPHMLALVERNLETESQSVRERLNFFRGDMSKFSLGESYDLIIIGVTSISLLLHSTQRLSMFACVSEHLKPGGKLVFDIMDFDEGRWKNFDDYLDIWSRETDDGQDFAIVGQKFFPEEGKFSFNVYREFISWSGETTRTIGSSVKALLTSVQLKDEMEQSGLKLVSEFRRGELKFFVSEVSDG